MFLSGISDEAGQPIEIQIKAHKELGWDHLELRMVDGTNITQLADDAFEAVRRAVDEAGMKVSCFGSAIANWARPITCNPRMDVADLERSIPRMRQMGTEFIRVMSYPNDPENPVDEPTWRKEAIARMKKLAAIAEDGGIILAHENCSGWGGLSADNSNILLGEVGSPALRVVYDTGNPVSYKQDAWDYYQKVQDHIVYVHIKDANIVDGEAVYCYCGEGQGFVKETVTDLLSKGYDGGFSIEPHLAAVIHTGASTDDKDVLYNSYTEYGRRMAAIVQAAKAAI